MTFRILPLVLLLASGLSGCQTGLGRIDRSAQAAGLSRTVVQGQQYRHVVYANRDARRLAQGKSHRTRTGGRGGQAAPADRLVVFLDGDGRPWSADGQQPSADPTTQNPLALKLLARTRAPSLYISRPCYQQLKDPGCSPEIWTGGRYSRAVVESIATAIGNTAYGARQPELILVGYSGGGALAVLVAERLPKVAAVVSIAADLDIDAWTRHHDYLPLTTSLNPATSDFKHPWLEIHLQGARDTIVPMETTAAYFARHARALRWPFQQYDHVCCWVESWPESFAQVQAALQDPAVATVPPRAAGNLPASRPAGRR